MLRQQPNNLLCMSSFNPGLTVNISQTFDFKQNTLEGTLIWRGRNEPLETTSTTLARYGEITSDNNQQPPSLRIRPELLSGVHRDNTLVLVYTPIAGLHHRHRSAATTCAQASTKRPSKNLNSTAPSAYIQPPSPTDCSLNTSAHRFEMAGTRNYDFLVRSLTGTDGCGS